MTADRAAIRALIAERDALEQQITTISDRLRARGVDQDTRLVDNEVQAPGPSVCSRHTSLQRNADSFDMRCKKLFHRHRLRWQ